MTAYVMKVGDPAHDQRERKWTAMIDDRDYWKARAEAAEKDRDAGRELMRQAWEILNGIRASRGAPDGIDHEWFDGLVTGIRGCLADDALPWMTKAARVIVAPYQKREDEAYARIADLEARLARVPDREAVARGLRAQYMGDPSDTWEDAEDEDRSIYLEMADFCLAVLALFAAQETKP